MVRVRTFYQTDPAAIHPGGIDPLHPRHAQGRAERHRALGGGLTTDPLARPVGQLDRMHGRRAAASGSSRWAACAIPAAAAASRLSLQLTWGIARHFYACASGCDVLEFHRVEPSLAFLRRHAAEETRSSTPTPPTRRATRTPTSAGKRRRGCSS
jgi:hypothetical protein